MLPFSSWKRPYIVEGVANQLILKTHEACICVAFTLIEILSVDDNDALTFNANIIFKRRTSEQFFVLVLQ